MSVEGYLSRLSTPDWVAIGLLLVYVARFSWMTIRQHESFQTNALDLAKFDQAIWNTARGRPFQISLIEHSVVESHFSPFSAVGCWSSATAVTRIVPPTSCHIPPDSGTSLGTRSCGWGSTTLAGTDC